MEEDKEEIKSLNLNHNPQELDNNTEMNSSVKKQEKPKIYQVKKGYSRSNDNTYHGPTSYKEEENTSSYSSSGCVRDNSSDVEIITRPVTWKGKKTKKKNQYNESDS
eukprot:352207-Ditylum_brightwellii.AAC.1